jgi:indoleamine 2,3-dioxygenase
VVYEGVHAEPRRYIGGSAGQSSLFQVFDAVLGLAHPDKPAGGYLRAIRAYMPPAHRAFVEDVERQSLVRSRAQQGSPALRAAYNDCLDQVDLFREIHMQLAQDFVVTPSGSSSDVQGTGGTALRSFLRGAQHATVSAKL